MTSSSRASAERYVPAAGRAALTRLYDPVMALTMREATWRPAVLEQAAAALPDDGRAVDIGAGTGTFAIALAAQRPRGTVTAVDPDPDAVALARAKPGAERVHWRDGRADELPIDRGEIHVAVMSLLLHHLGPEAKQAALQEALRVLRPGGRLVVADWGRPAGALPWIGFMAVRALDGFDGTRDHVRGRLAALVTDAGFVATRRLRRVATAWGTLELLVANAPER